MSILDFYSDILTALRYQVDDEDLISFVPPEGSPVPATVDKRRLVLPTKARLREGFDSELQPFHPLAESVARKGASPVLAHMQRCAKAVLAFYYVGIASRLLTIAAETDRHKDLPPNCADFLKKLANADKKSLVDFSALIKAAIKENKLVVLYLKNGGKLDGDKYNRLCVVHFPLTDLLYSDEDVVLGVKLRKKDRKTFAELLQHILPMGNDPEYYSAGSNSRIAPFMDAFLQAYAKVAEQFNTVVRRYAEVLDLVSGGKDISDAPLTLIPLKYREGLKNMKEYYDKIPSLRGNEGALAKGEAEEPEPTRAPVNALYDKVNAPSPSAESRRDLAPWDPEPVATPSSADSGSGMSMDAFRKSLAPPPPPQQAAGYGHPQAAAGYNPYSQPPQDPRLPAWLVGQQQPVQAASPFAQALMPQPTTLPMQGYGAVSGNSNFGAPAVAYQPPPTRL